MNRIAHIVHYLMNNPEILLSIFYGQSCLLHVNEIETKAILHSLLKNYDPL